MSPSATNRILQHLAAQSPAAFTSTECAQQLALPKSFNTHSSMLHLLNLGLVEKRDSTKPFAYRITPLGQQRASEQAAQAPRPAGRKPSTEKRPRKPATPDRHPVRVTAAAPPPSRSAAAQAFAEHLIDNTRRAVLLVRTVIEADLDGLTPALEAALDNADHAVALLATGYRAVA